MNPLTQELFDAARAADRARVDALLEDARVDVLARDRSGHFASDVVPVGNVTMDPPDVAALQDVARVISAAIARALHVRVADAPGAIEPLLRAYVARIAPSPENNGGGTLVVHCSRADESTASSGSHDACSAWRLRIEGDYEGARCGADPPWQLRAELLVTADPRAGLTELARLRWDTT